MECIRRRTTNTVAHFFTVYLIFKLKMEDKWICDVCTYENYSNSKLCIMCRVGEARNGLLKGDKVEDLKFHKLSLGCDTGVRRKMSSPIGSKRKSSNINSSLILSDDSDTLEESENCDNKGDKFSNPYKWVCARCTYENWPKSKQCVICKAIPNLPVISPNTTNIENVENNMFLEGSILSCTPKQDKANFESVDKSIVIKNNEINQADSRAKVKPVNYGYEESNKLLGSLECFDWKWINACVSVVHGNTGFIEEYFSNGGDPLRTVSPTDMVLLKYLGNFKVGYNLLHIALWNESIDIAKNLPKELQLPLKDRVTPGVACASRATRLFRHIMSMKEQCCGKVSIIHIKEISTFYLPDEIDKLSSMAQNKLWSDLLDKNSQQELDKTVINWDEDIVGCHGSKLFALWNRTCGDCILDSVLQCTYGILDTENVLRTLLADTILVTAECFYPRWKEYELRQANELGYCLHEKQLADEWAKTVRLAGLPGNSLEPFHIFVLCHILKRPIIVYGDKYVQSFDGDYLGLARFGGIYLPYLCDNTTCYKSPIALGYTRGHISALVPKESSYNSDASKSDDNLLFLLPLVSSDGLFLPLPFATSEENTEPVEVYKRYLEVDVTDKGVLVAKLQIPKLPLLVSEMVYDWLAYFKLFDNPCSITRPV